MARQIKIMLQGLEYVTPDVPKQIRGRDLMKRDQVWSRDTTYLQWDWNTDPAQGFVWHEKPAKGQIEWYEAEIERLHTGAWIMIYGEPVYFNKYAYFFHQWFMLQEGIYPIFKDTSLEYFRFYQICEDDDFTLGDCGIKGRRVGLSSMKASINLLIGLLEENTLQGIVSKTGTDAKEMYLMVKNGLENLPEFLMPDLAKVAETELHIAKPRSRISTNNKTVSGDKGKNNRINWLSTAENAYDGRRARNITIDECMSPDTKILCDGFVFREIKDINVGDYIIVEGGKRKRVAKVFNGQDEMFLVKQPYSKDYVVSSKHRLYLEQRCSVKTIKDDGIKIITPLEAINLGKYKKRTTYGVRSSGIDIKSKQNLIDPYIFGAWIGDGFSQAMGFIVNYEDDLELYEYIKYYGKGLGYNVSEHKVSNSKKVVRLYYTMAERGKGTYTNPLMDELKRLNVLNNKHIPNEYLFNSRENRLKLLAGIIDTDGHCSIKKGSIHITMSNTEIIDQIIFLCRSLGLSVSKNRISKTNFNTSSYKVSISGNLSEIPTILKRKQFNGYVQQSKYRRNGIEVSSIGIGEYVGIQVEATNDDDRRLILEDFTLTMNCAKWEEANVEICLAKISETLVIGASVIGHVSAFSSVNRGDKGGNNFKNIWLGSNHLGKLDSIGQTETRLKRFFLEGYRGYFGYIDKYGNSVIENPTPEQTAYLTKLVDPTTGKKACPNPKIGAKQYIQERRSLLSNNPEKLSEWVRMYPFEWQEVFKDSNNMCHFNLNELNEQILSIELELEGKNKSENGRVGLFKKHDSGEVYFVDNPKGMWYILEFPDNNNRSVYNGSIKCPNNTSYGASGLDTFANAKQTVEKGSDACCIIHKRYDSLNPDESNMPIAMFIGRPKTKEEFHSQIFYGLEYYGIKMLAERSPTDWEDYAITKRYASPLDSSKKHGYLISTKRSNNSEVYGIAPQDKEAREQHLTEMVEYALNNMHKIKFLRLLKDMVNFNINSRTDYDACMAWGYALMGLKEHQLAVKKVDNSKLKVFHIFNKPAAQKYH